jgi:hypothetical protein
VHDDGTPSTASPPPWHSPHNGVLPIEQTNHNHQPKKIQKPCWWPKDTIVGELQAPSIAKMSIATKTKRWWW